MTEEFDDHSVDDADATDDDNVADVDEVELLCDEDGIAIVGSDDAIERFLSSVPAPPSNSAWKPLQRTTKTAGTAARVGSDLAANSGRWMKLTDESVQWAKNFPLVRNATTGHLHATARAKDGPRFVKNLQFEAGAGRMLTNPANLANAGALMAQVAMQQTMDEIVSYLETIDEKVDDILRSQQDAVLADMIGVDLIVTDAMTVREELGRVPEVTWAQIQSATLVVARTQAYALRQLDALAAKTEEKSKIGELAKSAEAAAASVHDWLAVMARCFQLQEAIAILELDRVLELTPHEVDQHRVALQTARSSRRALMAKVTTELLERMASATERANSKVLFNPSSSPSVVQASNEVGTAVATFRTHVGIHDSQQELEARRWAQAAGDVKDRALGAAGEAKDRALDVAGKAKDRALEVGADGLDSAKRIGTQVLGRAKSAKRGLAGKLRRDDD